MNERFTVQLILGSLVALGLPVVMVLLLQDSGLTQTNFANSIVAAAAAFGSGLVLSRRLRVYPGVVQVATELPIFIGTYSLAAIAVLVLRVDYSNTYLLSSFVLAVAITLLFASAFVRGRLPRYAVVPIGNATRLKHIRWAEFVPMDSPRLKLEGRVDGVVADLRADLPPEWEQALADVALQGCPVYHFKQLEEALTGKVDIEHLSENSLGSLIPNRAFADIKSIVDRLCALAVLPLVALPCALVALAIKLDSPGPVFFRQSRIGRGGAPFTVIKFRSMQCSQQRGDERIASVTQDHDGRITRVGAFIRRYRIDEVPQLINVLRGEMSWIGPRPEAHALAEWYEAELPFYAYRHIVRPGITGWAQVNQGHVADLTSVHDKLRYDFYYIKNFSLWLDLVIILRTVRIVLGGFGVK
ncbi:MAG: sugar transferase [Erythrobacter sp.]